MNRILCALTFLACEAVGAVPICGAEPADARPEKDKAKRHGPLAELPSKAGAHVEKIKALGDDEWLNLGAPAADRVICVVYGARKTGGFVFDPATSAWAERPLPFPAKGPDVSRCWNGFYSPELNAHFFHVAGDSRDDGTVWVYRYKKAPDKK